MNDKATDQQIVAQLRDDGRLSNREVARRLNVSEGMVRQRLKKLQDSGALRIGAVINPADVGLHCYVYVRLTVSPKDLKSATAALSALAEVAFVTSTVGAYNVIMLVVTTDQEALAVLLNSQIQRVAGVRRVDVRPVVVSYKHDYHLVRIPRMTSNQ